MPASIRHLTDRRINYYSLLARWKDGLYYSAALIRCDRANKRCRVCFEDGSEIWVSTREVHLQLQADKLTDDEDIVCCICDDGSSVAPNEIILCDVCNQGYHQKCHTPPVDSSKLDGNDDLEQHIDWFCATCSFILNQTNRAKPDTAIQPQQQQRDELDQKGDRGQHEPKPVERAPVKLQGANLDRGEASNVKSNSATAAAKACEHSDSKNSKPQDNGQASSTVVAKSQPPKVKQTPTIQQQKQQHQPPQHKAGTIGAMKPSASHHQRSAPYYPISSQVRASVAFGTLTTSLAPTTASSALLVGSSSSSGRTKQELVNKSSSQRQLQTGFNNNNEALPQTTTTKSGVVSISPPKHAVRKSSINYSVNSPEQPVRQSALPTATRSTPSSAATISGVKPPSSSVVVTQIIPNPAGQQNPSSGSTVTSTRIPTIITTKSPPEHQQQKNSIDKYTNSALDFQPLSGEPRSVVTTAAAVAAAGGTLLNPTICLIDPKSNSHQATSANSAVSGAQHTTSVINSKQIGVIKEPIHSSVEHQHHHQRDVNSSSSPSKSVVTSVANVAAKVDSHAGVSGSNNNVSSSNVSPSSLSNNNSSSSDDTQADSTNRKLVVVENRDTDSL